MSQESPTFVRPPNTPHNKPAYDDYEESLISSILVNIHIYNSLFTYPYNNILYLHRMNQKRRLRRVRMKQKKNKQYEIIVS